MQGGHITVSSQLTPTAIGQGDGVNLSLTMQSGTATVNLPQGSSSIAMAPGSTLFASHGTYQVTVNGNSSAATTTINTLDTHTTVNVQQGSETVVMKVQNDQSTGPDNVTIDWKGQVSDSNVILSQHGNDLWIGLATAQDPQAQSPTDVVIIKNEFNTAGSGATYLTLDVDPGHQINLAGINASNPVSVHTLLW